MKEQARNFWDNLEPGTKAIAALITALGAIILGYWTMGTNRITADYGAYNTIIPKLESRIESLELAMADLQLAYNELMVENNVLKNSIILLSTSNIDVPFPAWIKNSDGVMLKANLAYQTVFLNHINKGLHDYIGKTDYDIWPNDVADQYTQNDQMVMKTGRVYTGTENVIMDGRREQWFIIKYRWKAANGVVLGVAGMALPKDFIEYIQEH